LRSSKKFYFLPAWNRVFRQENRLTPIKLYPQKSAEMRRIKDNGGHSRSPRLQHWNAMRIVSGAQARKNICKLLITKYLVGWRLQLKQNTALSRGGSIAASSPGEVLSDQPIARCCIERLSSQSLKALLIRAELGLTPARITHTTCPIHLTRDPAHSPKGGRAFCLRRSSILHPGDKVVVKGRLASAFSWRSISYLLTVNF